MWKVLIPLLAALVFVACGDSIVDVAPPERPAQAAREVREAAPSPASRPAERPEPEAPPVEKRPRLLIVTDARTGRALTDVEVFATTGPYPDEHPGPGRPGTRIVGPADSPVAIPGELPAIDLIRPRKNAVYVRAPGYAFQLLYLTSVGEGEIEVGLESGGDLRVEIDGEDRDRGTVLRVRAPGDPPLCEGYLAAENRMEMKSLPAGRYRVAAEIGDWGDDPWVLAHADVEVRAGESASVTLQLCPRPRPVRVPMAGRVVVPPEWNIGPPDLRFQLLDIPLDGEEVWRAVPSGRLLPEGIGVYRFDAGEVQAGRWRVEVGDIGFATWLLVGYSKGICIEVPPPATLHVRVVDAQTGYPAGTDTVKWRSMLEAGYRGRIARRGSREGPIEVRVPAGRTRVSCVNRDNYWSDATVAVDAVPGVNDVLLEVTAGALIRIELREDGILRSWPGFDDEFDLLLEHEPTGRPVSDWVLYPTRERWSYLRVLEGGKYRIRFTPPAGYEPIPDAVVEAKLRETVSHAVDLRRKR